MCEVFQKRRTFGTSGYPFSIARPEAVDYRSDRFPGTMNALERVLVIPWNDRYTDDDVEYISDGIAHAVRSLSGEFLRA
jgi:dTDP-4-amino-4,6-dideoxygalactose transaminase